MTNKPEIYLFWDNPGDCEYARITEVVDKYSKEFNNYDIKSIVKAMKEKMKADRSVIAYTAEEFLLSLKTSEEEDDE